MTPMQRYEWATSPEGWLTAAGWERLAEDLDSVEVRWLACTPFAQKLTDRAADCRARAARMVAQ